ncbi:nicotinamidase [Candidatus Entotheonella serta]|nr:nicotinamidase [Candidatus Entotheonella serta]
MALPLPDFYDSELVGNVYVERAAMIAEAAEAYRQRHTIAPTTDDQFRIAAFGIDCQVGFCTPEASLFVPGAVEDMQRTLQWLYGNLGKLSAMFFTLDTHHLYQIFHPVWWVDREGRHPEPFTPISYEDVENGTWTPVAHREACLEYCRKLDANGKYVLTIWPYHVLLGGVSHTLVPALMEASIFHSLVRGCQTHFEIKGTHDLTEHYSVLSPEVQELGGEAVGAFNETFFNAVMAYDRVYVFGQAKSHCVRSTLFDMRDRLEASEPELLNKIWILQDAMSPVPPPPLDPLPPELDFPRLADEAIEALQQAGMHVVDTSAPIEVP